MSIPETVLVYVAAPLAVIAIIAGIVFASGGKSRTRRYRPGRPYDFAPVWFTASGETAGTHAEDAHGAAIEHRSPQAALPAAVSAPGVTGGASDRW
ncbi:aa3-type cytochrome oxidase subunit CtaJ [Hamadaea tsunoensis]|uniref:aa3-type cytochrome oxidase subunit CtaJ n=1 Tax=Hamadaea tsunoensis TaxID=53368 RepID=UPI00048113AE|nr:hypothetical protein [Hamadaea tsunoensis]